MKPFVAQLLCKQINLHVVLVSFCFTLCVTSPILNATNDRDRVGQVIPSSSHSLTSNNYYNGDSINVRRESKNYSTRDTSSSNVNAFTGHHSNQSSYNGEWSTSLPVLSTKELFETTTVDSLTTDDYLSSSDNLMYRPSVLVPEVNFNPSGIPDCLASSSDTYCETVSQYPSINLRKEIKMSPNEFREMFGQSIMDGRKSYADDESSDEERICRRIPRIVYPKMARNLANNQWLFIVNDAEYTQPVIIEQCE